MAFSMSDFTYLATCPSSIRNTFLRQMAAKWQIESAAFLLLVSDYKLNTTHKKAQFITEVYINPGGGRQEFTSGAGNASKLGDNLWAAPINVPAMTTELLNVKRSANYISDRRKYPDLFDPFVALVVALLHAQNPPIDILFRKSPPKISAAAEKHLIEFSQAVKLAGFDPEECGIY
jgi:hypothetical protein